MYQVIKRDGKISEFDIAKISNAIQKAFDAVERQYHPSIPSSDSKGTSEKLPGATRIQIALADTRTAEFECQYEPTFHFPFVELDSILYQHARSHVRQSVPDQLCQADSEKLGLLFGGQ